MRYRLILVILLALSLGLTACVGDANAGATSTTTTPGAPAAADGTLPGQTELSAMAKDIVGIFKLEGTEQAVTAEQASVLLPLWQAYRALLNSDTAASAELQALQTQIEETLNTEQRAAITSMNLSAQDMFAMAEQLGVMQTPSSGDEGGNSAGRPGFAGGGFPGGAGGAAPPSGGPMPGGPGGEGGFAFRGGGQAPDDFDPSMMPSGTPQPGRAALNRQGDRFTRVLLDALIKLLKERAGS